MREHRLFKSNACIIDDEGFVFSPAQKDKERKDSDIVQRYETQIVYVRSTV